MGAASSFELRKPLFKFSFCVCYFLNFFFKEIQRTERGTRTEQHVLTCKTFSPHHVMKKILSLRSYRCYLRGSSTTALLTSPLVLEGATRIYFAFVDSFRSISFRNFTKEGNQFILKLKTLLYISSSLCVYLWLWVRARDWNIHRKKITTLKHLSWNLYCLYIFEMRISLRYLK